MRKVRISVPYGRHSLKFSVEADRLLGILTNNAPARSSIRELLTRAFDTKDAKESLARITGSVRRLLLVVPDVTRPAHLRTVLPFILAKVGRGPDVEIIIATGLHKRHNSAEIRALVGDAVHAKYRVYSHYQGRNNLTRLGVTGRGVPIVLNKAVHGYDAVATVGLVEPHLYAGYSGGAKTVAIGLAGEETISATHNTIFLDDPRTAIGSVENNPFQRTLWEIASKVPVKFSVNIVNNPEGDALAVFAGKPAAVFKDAVRFSKNIFDLTVNFGADIVICGIGYPKDANLYQASRAVNYVLNVDRPVLHRGGILIVVAALDDGVGGGLSEKRFYRELISLASPEDFVTRIRRNGCVAGLHRAYMVAKHMRGHRIIFVSKDKERIFSGLPLGYFNSIEDALRSADRGTGGRSKIYVIPHALSTIAGLR